MKKIIFLLIALVCAFVSANADVVKEGNTYVAVKSSNGRTSTQPEKTGLKYKDTKGNEYDIYISTTGSCFILKTSQKTGKEYKQYLGVETSQQICKDLGREYKGKTNAPDNSK